MAKLLAARIAWSNADNAVQIHGGNGFAMEFPISRILCDARILSIFEGAAEIQAQVIARRLLADRTDQGAQDQASSISQRGPTSAGYGRSGRPAQDEGGGHQRGCSAR